jgi:uncharacterized membrane protein
MHTAQRSIVVKAPVADVYKRWLAFEDHPRFFSAIKGVRKLDDCHFTASVAFDGKQRNAMLEIVLRVPERRLAWRIVFENDAPPHFMVGVVSFASHPDGSTRVTLKLTSNFAAAVSHRVKTYLHKFKVLIEAAPSHARNLRMVA